MTEKPKKSDGIKVAVVVGRFQTDTIRVGHAHILNYPVKEHGAEVLVIGVGVNRIGPSINDPLDFITRREMLNAFIAQSSDLKPVIRFIVPIMDQPGDDAAWVASLDKLVAGYTGTGRSPHEARLFGSRGSFIQTYSANNGRYSTEVIDSIDGYSGTAIRKDIGEAVTRMTNDFRRGCIYATQHQFPKVYATVDIGVYDLVYSAGVCTGYRILLGRKSDGQGWRFPGGFSDPSVDESFEAAAARELSEEVGSDVNYGGMEYVTSAKINDARYKSQQDKIVTTMFATRYLWGTAKACDDLEEVRWFTLQTAGDYNSLADDIIAINHEHIFRKLSAYLLSKYLGNKQPSINTYATTISSKQHQHQ